jgi:hypothetical protein
MRLCHIQNQLNLRLDGTPYEISNHLFRPLATSVLPFCTNLAYSECLAAVSPLPMESFRLSFKQDITELIYSYDSIGIPIIISHLNLSSTEALKYLDFIRTNVAVIERCESNNKTSLIWNSKLFAKNGVSVVVLS